MHAIVSTCIIPLARLHPWGKPSSKRIASLLSPCSRVTLTPAMSAILDILRRGVFIKKCLACKVHLTATLSNQRGKEISWKFTPLLDNPASAIIGKPEQFLLDLRKSQLITFPRFHCLPAAVFG